jgi:Cytochrome P450
LFASREGERISAGEMVAMVFLLLGCWDRDHDAPDQRIGPRARQESEPARLARRGLEPRQFGDRGIPAIVSPVQFSKPRFVRKDVELGGARLRKGEKIMAMLAAANMDPEVIEHPDRLDLERRPNRHLAFGTGIHFCLGHQLARVEGKCALQALFTRWPRLEMAVSDAQIRWRERPGLRAIEALPVVARRV